MPAVSVGGSGSCSMRADSAGVGRPRSCPGCAWGERGHAGGHSCLPGSPCLLRMEGIPGVQGSAVCSAGLEQKQSEVWCCSGPSMFPTCQHSASARAWGQAGPRAPEHPWVPTRCSPGHKPSVIPTPRMLSVGSGATTPSQAGGRSGASPSEQNPGCFYHLHHHPRSRQPPRDAAPGAGPGCSWEAAKAALVFPELDACPSREAAAAQLIPGPRKAAPAPAHSVPASAGAGRELRVSPPRCTAVPTPPQSADPPPEDSSLQARLWLSILQLDPRDGSLIFFLGWGG